MITSKFARVTALIVDPNPHHRSIVSEILRAAGVTSVGGEVPFTLAPAVPREDKPARADADIGDVRDFIGEHARHGREDAS